MKLCVLSYYKAHNYIMYKTIETNMKKFLKTISNRVGERSAETRRLTSDIPTYKTVHFYIQPYFTLTVIILLEYSNYVHKMK